MGTAVPIPDAGAQAALASARSDAAQELQKGQSQLQSDIASTPDPYSHKVDVSLKAGAKAAPSTGAIPGPADTGAVPYGNEQVTKPIDPGVQPVEQPSFAAALADNAGQVGGEAGLGAMRAGVGIAKTAGNVVGFLAHKWADTLDQLGFDTGLNDVKTKSRTLANGKQVTGEFSGDRDDNVAPSDQAFQFVRDHVSTAMDAWKSNPENSTASHIVGNVAESAAPLLLGPAAGVPAFVANAASNAGTDSIDRGEDAKTAAALAIVHGTAAALYPAISKIPFKNPTLIKKVATSVGLGEPVSVLTDYLTKQILDSNDYKEAAANINPLDPESLVSGTLLQTIFGIIESPRVQKRAQQIADNGGASVPPPAKTGAAQPGPADTGAAPPPAAAPLPVDAPVKQVAQATAAKSVAAEPAPIKDTPSVEPHDDLKAQRAELENPLSGRSGVYLSPENVAALGPDGVKKLAAGLPISSNFGGNGAVMIFADKGERVKGIAAAKAPGADLQAVIGKITGAGDGKRPDQTAVVQGQTLEGAVASESAVTPAEVPAKVEQVKAEGNTPVVTTPEAAVQRRAELVAGDHAVVDGKAVVIAGEGKDGTTQVHEIGQDGEVSEATTSVPTGKVLPPSRRRVAVTPEMLVKAKAAAQMQAEAMLAGTTETRVTPEKASSEVPAKNAEAPAAAAPEATKAEPAAEAKPVLSGNIKTETAPMPELDKAMQFLRDNAATKGKKGGLVDRASAIGSAATVLRMEAEHADENNLAPADAIERAMAAAKAAEGMKDKSAEDINKGRGVDNDTLDAHAKELLAATDQLQGRPAAPKDTTPIKAKKLAKVMGKEKAAAAKTETAVAAIPDETVSAGGADRSIRELVTEAKKRGVKATIKDLRSAFELSTPDALKLREAIQKTVAKKDLTKAARDQGKDKPIADIEDEVKKATAERAAREQREADQPLRKLERHEASNIDRLREDYKNAGKDSAKFRRERLEQALEKTYEPKTERQKHYVAELLRTADEDRARFNSRVRGGTEDEDEIEGEMGVRGVDYGETYGENPYKETERSDVPGGNDGVRWEGVHDALNFKHNVYERLQAYGDGKISAHEFLSKVLESAQKGSSIHDLATKLYHAVNAHYIHEATAQMQERRIGGVYKSRRDAQGNVLSQRILVDTSNPRSPHTTRIIMHELVHAAVADFIDTHPDHPAVKELENVRAVAEARLRRLYESKGMGEAFDQSVHYHRNGGAEPWMHIKDVYGISDIHEFLSELNTNPNFQKLLAVSERYATPGERLMNVLHETARAIARMFGIARPDTLRLLNASLGLSDNIIDLARRAAPDRAGPGIRTALMEARARAYEQGQPMGSNVNEFAGQEIERASIHEPGSIEAERDVQDKAKEVLDRPYTMRGEQAIRDVGGPSSVKIAKEFYRTVRSGTLGKLERDVMPWKTHDQIVRDGLHWFGDRDSPNNTLRKWDEAQTLGAAKQNEILEKFRPIQERAAHLSMADSKTLGEFMRDSTIWGIDPEVAAEKHSRATKAGYKFDQRYADFQKRWANLTPEQRGVYSSLRDFNRWAIRKNRNAGIDAALHTFSDAEVDDASRRILYSVTDPKQYEKLIGPGKAIDVGDRSKNLISSLTSLAGHSQIAGPYFHLGRYGDFVVTANREGVKSGFKTREQAEAFADLVRNLSPESEAQVAEHPDGTHSVEYKADYTSMHERESDAHAEVARLRDMGLEPGNVTDKLTKKDAGSLSLGAENLVAEATRRLKGGSGDAEHVTELVDTMRKAFVQMMAARSAYAGSQLMRKGTAGVKGEDMLRSAANHVLSLSWSTGQLASVFHKGEALGNIRKAVKDDPTIDQRTAFERGRVLTEINSRMAQDQAQLGIHQPFNSALAKIGFANFLGSPSHAFIWMTQNFTTGLPVAAARWGGFRSAGAFRASMALVSGPAFRETFLAHLPRQLNKGENITVHHVVSSVLKAVESDPRFGKWAKGENNLLQQVFERGAISNSFSNEISSMAHSESPLVTKVMDYARLLPHMADTINRVSSALVALELTGGDVYKAADFVKETHMDYSGANKPRAFKTLNHVWGGNSITMFKTYAQGMVHLLYGNIKHMSTINLPDTAKTRSEAAMTVAGVMAATSILAGVSAGAILEPLRLAYYAYHKIFDGKGEDSNLDNVMDRFWSHLLGHTAGEAVSRGVTRVIPGGFDFDLSSRMGLASLFFHNPPDLLKGDTKELAQFLGDQLGPMPQMIGGDIHAFNQHMADGEPWKAMGAIVPIKAVNDLAKAVQEGTTGKISNTGARVTKPSIPGALVRAAGFRTGDEARASERQQAAYGQSQAQYELKAQILNRAARQGYTADVAKAVDDFNRRFPDTPIRNRNVLSKERAKAAAEQLAQGAKNPTRSPLINEKLDY